MFPWCSGYHVRLTRGRSPVRARPETLCLIFFIQLLQLVIIIACHEFFFELFDGLSKEKIRTEAMSMILNNIIEVMLMVKFSLLFLKELGKSSRTNILNYNLSNIFGRAR